MNVLAYEAVGETAFWQMLSLSSILHLAAFVWVAQHLIRHRRDPVSMMLWIMVAWTLPFFGFVLYLTFGINRVAAKSWKKESANRRFLDERTSREAAELPLSYWHSIRAAVAHEPAAPVARAIDRVVAAEVTDHPLLGGNRIDLLIDGDEAFPRMMAAIESARNHIHLQSFIIGNDVVGKALMDRLAAKAREGVRVRVLYDRFGSTFAVLGGLFYRYRNVPNLHIAGWSMARLFKKQFPVNLRNHRKVLIVDGVTGFTGGINLQAKNITREKQSPIRDYHVALAGPIVSELQYTFLRDWYYITDEDPDHLLCAEHFPRLEPQGSAAIRMINGGPATELDEICDTLFACLVSAQKQILAVTPYFIPTSDIIRGLRHAALRGVDVRVVVPQKNNHVYAGWAGRAYYDELLESGVRVYERRPPFMHAKGLLIDDEVAMIGTANLDVRSLKLNYETNLLVYDDGFINRLKAVMLDELARSHEIDLNLWRQRPLGQRMKENASSMLTPIL
ncbi:MAG TPA: cardiolipin synthase [Kiritimatiellia bacterium]|nr:cardiolipin synthase [Kiritimatiellia bacterium]HMO98010.1 cardiolipin synthase [Kiritimatiellia bacterium]HMP95360.1 cardiolipin synthase [Kiritimatiellia bacterium]